MSTWPPIWNVIKSHEAAGRLIRLPLRVPKDPIVRAMFLVPTLHAKLMCSREDDIEKRRYVALRASLEKFVTNANLESSYLKPLSPKADCVWEIVNKKPRPSLRVFGLFATRDVFIATNHQVRGFLGARGNPAWSEEIRRAVFEWRQLFHEHQQTPFRPLRGTLDEVISGAVHV